MADAALPPGFDHMVSDGIKKYKRNQAVLLVAGDSLRSLFSVLIKKVHERWYLARMRRAFLYFPWCSIFPAWFFFFLVFYSCRDRSLPNVLSVTKNQLTRLENIEYD